MQLPVGAIARISWFAISLAYRNVSTSGSTAKQPFAFSQLSQGLQFSLDLLIVLIFY